MTRPAGDRRSFVVSWQHSMMGGVLGCHDGYYSYPALGMQQVWCGSALIVLWDIARPGAASAVAPVPGGRNVDHVCIATSPFDHDELRRHFEKHEVTVVQEAFHGGVRRQDHSFYILDPFGNKLEIKGQRLIPTGAEIPKAAPKKMAAFVKRPVGEKVAGQCSVLSSSTAGISRLRRSM